MLKKYSYEVDVTPIDITWTEELVQEEDLGDFYVKLTPHVSDSTRSTTTSVGVLGAMARNQIAVQNRKVFEEIKKEAAKDVEKRLRAEYNKRRGQRWNKRV